MNNETRIIDLTVADLRSLIFDMAKEAFKEEEKRKADAKQIGGEDAIKGAKELAEFLNISVTKAFREIRSGKFDKAKVSIGERTNYYSKAKITEILTNN